jgi:hypothetical protein
LANNYANQKWTANQRAKNGVAVYPTDMSDNIFLPELIDYAVKMWKVSNSPLPPTPDELLYRDRAWDAACALYADAYDFKLQQREGKLNNG